MQNHIQYLIEKKVAFQPFNREPKILFLYIAPLDKAERERFFNIILKPQMIIVSNYKKLNDDELVKTILINYFPINTILDIFISTKDSNAPIVLEQSLYEYIREHKIAFEY